MQPRLDKPYMCETKPSVIVYLERALTGKMSEEEFIETQLPEKQLTALRNINKESSYSNAMFSLKLLPLLADCTLVQMFNDKGVKTEESVTSSTLMVEIITYLSILAEVMRTYITKVAEMVRSKPGVQVSKLMHNQVRYVQIAYLANPAEFTLPSMTDLDLYSYATMANIENTLIIQPFLRKTKIADYLRMVPYKSGETMSYALQSIGLTSRSIFPANGARLRLMARGDRLNNREFDLDFLGTDEEDAF